MCNGTWVYRNIWRTGRVLYTVGLVVNIFTDAFNGREVEHQGLGDFEIRTSTLLQCGLQRHRTQ